MHLILPPILSLVISLITVWFIKNRLSQQLLDIPNDRSSHTQPTPRGGGLGFIIATALTAPLTLPINTLIPLYLTLTPLTIIGILDDKLNVPSKIRYLIQILTASLAIYFVGTFAQPWLTPLGLPGQIIAILLTLIGFTAIINFYNFIDGIDGIVAGCSLVQISFLAIYLHQPQFWILSAALLGFLYFNWAPAKIFMGDSGSTFLGAIIAITLIGIPNPVTAWTALAIILPIITDAIYTLSRRLLNRENIFQAHRKHLYQRLQQTGLAHSTVASMYIALNMSIGLLILTNNYVGAITSVFMTVGFMVLGELYISRKQPIVGKI
jgi:Fuc2NAc and GlcNAc transferase